jgi:hypothetical protein
MKEKFEAIVAAVEKVPNNVYALVGILSGAALVALKHEEAGKMAMSSGFTMLSHKS